MIIFGTKGRDSQVGQGRFNCPQCRMQRAYEHKSVRRYFTLYFIPVIPLGSAGEYVQCESCGGTFGTEILTYDPEGRNRPGAWSSGKRPFHFCKCGAVGI